MGSAVGQVPEYTELITSWVKEVARTPVLVKLTPNVTDIRVLGRAAKKGGADGLSLINTVNSIVGVDLDTLRPIPHVAGRGSHGGYCGPAVKPIALNMVQSLAADPEVGLPISGIGGIQSWQDAVEFLLLGASSVQVCTAVMHYGFRLVEHLQSGLETWMADKGFSSIDQVVGRSVRAIGGWGELDLAYKVVAHIDEEACIHCGLCFVACDEGAHQSILRHQDPVTVKVQPGAGAGYVNRYEVDEATCVGCNLCSLVCPVHGCITMVERDSGRPSMTWNQYRERVERGEMATIAPPSAHRG